MWPGGSTTSTSTSTGMPVVAAAEVADRALQSRRYEIVTHMLAGRPDSSQAMAENRHVPDHHRQGPGLYRHARVSQSSQPGLSERARPRHRRQADELWRGEPAQPAARPLRRREHRRPRVLPHDRRRAAVDRPDLERAEERRRSKAPAARASIRTPTPARNAGEYWAEICQAYFDCNRVNNWNHGPIGTREQLQAYDPEGYELVRDRRSTSARSRIGGTRSLQKLPNVMPAAGQIQDRSVLHQIHLGPRVHRGRPRRERRGAAQGQRHDPQDCSPIGTTFSRR